MALIEELQEVGRKIDNLKLREGRMESVLLWLNERGGLGHDVHARILEALGPPNGKFCRQARVCLKAGRCMSDIVCND